MNVLDFNAVMYQFTRLSFQLLFFLPRECLDSAFLIAGCYLIILIFVSHHVY